MNFTTLDWGIIGVFFAACRFTLDRLTKACSVTAPARPVNLPLRALADWDKELVPQLVVKPGKSGLDADIVGRAAARGIEVELLAHA